MFEQELEMEKKESTIIPLLLILSLAGVILGSIGYWVVQMRKTLTPEQATAVVGDILKQQGPVVLIIHSGKVETSINEKPHDPHYKLLEKAGLLKTADVKGKDLVNVTLTPEGEKMITEIPEFKKTENKDGTASLFIPIASKQVVSISNVKMSGPNVAVVEYTWKWVPTPVGDIFDADNKLVKAFNIWDTQTLISKYDVNYYHGAPQKAVVRMVRGDNDQWKVTSD
jgi:hypothetical protein